MTQKELKVFLGEKHDFYNRPFFIESDPISIPHQFSKKEDIEISGFFAATFAWGQRATIIDKTKELLQKMDNAPYDFVLNFRSKDLENFQGFKHRTFNFEDLIFFLNSLQNIYKKQGGLENILTSKSGEPNMKNALARFREVFFETKHLHRSRKHVSDPFSNSACKRLNMFLRWMVRKDSRGVDFGIWKNHSPALLSCPLDVHTANVSRKLGLLKRKQNDWKSVEELDGNLKKMDSKDPVKYDFALFGLGVFEKF